LLDEADFRVLIVMFGMDGSGKTLMAKLVAAKLRSRGKKVRIIWLKSVHTIAYLMSLVLMRAGSWETIVNPRGHTVRRLRIPRHAKKVWLFIEFAGLLPSLFAKVYVPTMLRYEIVADRFLMDTIVSIAIRIGDQSFPDCFLSKVLMSLIPRRSLLIHLDVDVQDVLYRRPHIEYTHTEIRQQIAWYSMLARRLSAHSIDTSSADVRETFIAISNLISSAVTRQSSLPLTNMRVP